MRTCVIIIILIIALSHTTSAQSEYLSKGYNGVGGSVSYLTGNSSTGFGFSVAASMNGIVDIGFSYSRINIDGNYYYYDPSYTAIGGAVAFHPFNNHNATAQLAIEGGVSLIGLENSDAVYYILPYVRLDSKSKKGSNVLFRVGAGYASTPATNVHGNATYALGLSYYHIAKNKNIFFIGFSVSRINNNTTFGINLGGVIANLSKWKSGRGF